MTGFPERAVGSNFGAGLEENSTVSKSSKGSLWSNLFSGFPLFETGLSRGERKEVGCKLYGWTAAVKRVVSGGGGVGGPMRRFQERLLGTSKADVSSSTSDVWLLGVCYKVLQEDSSSNDSRSIAFLQDFSSRIWMTYRKGFDCIDTKYTTDVHWGCMIRSSQMLVAQALLFHYLGRSWRKPLQKPYDPKYIEILHLFGDSEACPFSLHNLLQAGRPYGLAAGSWVGPYAMCRTWASLARTCREHAEKGREVLPMAMYIVSGDEDGERGGAPVVCVDVAARFCSEFSKDQASWAPILLLVPLVLGLDKVNPRYIPLLCETFTFPQSLGVMGGKAGSSTYIVGVQDDKALYLDPHEVQQVVGVKRDDLEADTYSYHCSTVRHMSLDLLDPSLAIGFYCRDKDDFVDFCSRATELEARSNGAPLFTVIQCLQPVKSILHNDGDMASCENNETDNAFESDQTRDCDVHVNEDEWQIL